MVAIADVKRAYFEAEIQRDVCVRIPPEYWADGEGTGDVVGKLKKFLFGSRSASMGW